MRRFTLNIVIVQILIMVTQLSGWGYEVHRRISRAAVQAVDGEFGDFLNRFIDELSYNAANPDFWKTVDPDEFPRHFIDANLYDEYPFDNIPRNFDDLNTKYSAENVENNGIAPWVIDDYMIKIVEQMQKGEWEESIYSMSAMSHYIADLHMPLHTCANYNGQLTGNEGVHFRWETPMVQKYVNKIKASNSIEYIADPLEMTFTIVKESFSVYPEIIEADSKARAPLTEVQADSLNTYEKLSFEDEYLSILYSETGDIVQDQLNKSAERIAAYWYSCWIKAGSPSLPQ